MRKPRQNPLDKARAKPGSIRLAVNAKCYDCQGRDADPGVTERIRTCEIEADDAGYEKPVIRSPQDKFAELQRLYIESVKAQKELAERLEKLMLPISAAKLSAAK